MNKLPERIRIKDIARLADVSVGTVDRVIHSRSGVSEASKKRVEEILKQLDYQPNMYASALASNKKYTFICLLPEHLEGEYWTAVELGIHEAIATYSDFNTSVKITFNIFNSLINFFGNNLYLRSIIQYSLHLVKCNLSAANNKYRNIL